MSITVGLRGQVSHLVADPDTATTMGSGDVPVLATPRLLALAEAATVDALRGSLGADETSVGTRIDLEHLLPSPVGAEVDVVATVEHVDGRLVRFEVAATDRDGRLVGHGHVTRVVVDRQRFLSRLRGQA